MSELNLSILSKLRRPTSQNTNRKSLVGQKFNRWTVFSLAGYAKTKQAMSYWLCRCNCGNWGIVAKPKLKTGLSKSCGCHKIETAGDPVRTHGMSKTPTYCRWTDMLTRTSNPNTDSADYYINRGIAVCEALRNFEKFFALLGEVPHKQQLDRINNDGNYSCGTCEECLSKNWPMNVRWATQTIQARNKRNNILLTYNNETHCAGEWAEILNLSPLLIAKRKRSGWPDDECLGFKHRASADRYRRKL